MYERRRACEDPSESIGGAPDGSSGAVPEQTADGHTDQHRSTAAVSSVQAAPVAHGHTEPNTPPQVSYTQDGCDQNHLWSKFFHGLLGHIPPAVPRGRISDALCPVIAPLPSARAKCPAYYSTPVSRVFAALIAN